MKIPRDERPPLPLMARELWDATDVGQALGCSRSQVYELLRVGVLPNPIDVADSRRWRRREIVDWVSAGCPCRDDFNWRPGVPAKLEAFVAVLSREAADLQAEIRSLEIRRAKGDTMALAELRR